MAALKRSSDGGRWKRSLRWWVVVTICSTPLHAQTLYKHVDKDGRVTYTDRPPTQDGTTKAVVIPIDQNKLAPPVPKPAAPPQAREETEYEKIIRRKPPAANDSELIEAKRRLEDARAALEQAEQSSSPEDWILMNRPGIGLRRAPRPEYELKLKRLQEEVKAAEDKVADLERKARGS